MGKALRRGVEGGGGGRGAAARVATGTRAARAVVAALWSIALAALCAAAGPRAARGQERGAAPSAIRLDSGRFTVVAYPRDLPLARALLGAALRQDSFPGLPRPAERALIAVAPDRATFREWVGPLAPEWGAAIAFPESHRIVMQGSRAGSDAGEPIEVLRHELAHLALHEALGDLPPRWFDEGYASYSARELDREEVLATNVSLALRGTPTLGGLDSAFMYGSTEAQSAYALSYRAVADLAALDTARGLALFFDYWRSSGSFEVAVRSAYGITAAAFEKRWQSQTRRRYGALALFADLTLGTLFLLLLVVPFYVIRRRRDRRRMSALREDDLAAERRQREQRILDELLGVGPAAGATNEQPPVGERPHSDESVD